MGSSKLGAIHKAPLAPAEKGPQEESTSAPQFSRR